MMPLIILNDSFKNNKFPIVNYLTAILTPIINTKKSHVSWDEWIENF